MAIYHLCAKLVSRKAGRSSVAAAAYRAGERIIDSRTGEVHDYTKKRGIDHRELLMPDGSDWQPERAELWNAVEVKNKRMDAQVAREFVVALPAELSADERKALALDFARGIADEYGIAADVCIHRPGGKGDERNYHAHILTTTNRIEGRGLGNKARELDLVAHNMAGNVGKANAIDHLRQEWESRCNSALERAGRSVRIDHRTLKAQGIDRVPQPHLGPAGTAIERKGRGESHIRRRHAARTAPAAELARLDRQIGALEGEVRDAERESQAAAAERAEAERTRREIRAALEVRAAAEARAAAQARAAAEAARASAQAPAQASAQANPVATAQQKIVQAFQERMLRGFAPSAPAADPDPDQDDQDDQDAPHG